MEIKKCNRCKQFIGRQGQATAKRPEVFYCRFCYEQGLAIEEEAMWG